MIKLENWVETMHGIFVYVIDANCRYEIQVANIYKSRKDHKLDEWRNFCKWIEELPYSELIMGGKR